MIVQRKTIKVGYQKISYRLKIQNEVSFCLSLSSKPTFIDLYFVNIFLNGKNKKTIILQLRRIILYLKFYFVLRLISINAWLS